MLYFSWAAYCQRSLGEAEASLSFRERNSDVGDTAYAPQFYIGAVAVGDGASGVALAGWFGVGFHLGWQVTQCLPSQSVLLLKPAVPVLQ